MKNKQKFYDKLDNELSNLYHNATVSYPYEIMEIYQNLTSCDAMDKFYNMAEFEVEYINDFLGLSKKELYKSQYRKIKSNYDSYQLASQLVNEYGRCYTYGRGGRTLAPNKLIRSNGCGFSIKTSEDLNLNYESAVELYNQVKAFNNYVENWCSKENIKFMFKDEIENIIYENKLEISNNRKKLLNLIKDIKTNVKRANGVVCELLTSEVKSLYRSIKDLQLKNNLASKELKTI